MGSAEFEYNCVKLLDDFYTNMGCGDEDFSIYMVWSCKILKNNKGLFSTDRDNDNRYFEITYNGDTDEFYVDCYRKEWNQAVPAKLERMGM